MTSPDLISRARQLIAQPIPLPGHGHTADPPRCLFAAGLEDLSLARIVEPHFDAIAILAEARREPAPNALYAVWAAEAPDKILRIDNLSISGQKPFCSGALLVDHALITVKAPTPILVDIDLNQHAAHLRFDTTTWKTPAFAETNTALATFNTLPITAADIIGPASFYLERPGFWHGACGPAACWAGGAAGLAQWAATQKRNDPHTRAHLGAMHAAVWSMQSCLHTAGQEIDATWNDLSAAQSRALTVRHIVEQASTGILERLARAFGPHPLALDGAISRRIHELALYIRQSHAERDLEALGNLVHRAS